MATVLFELFEIGAAAAGILEHNAKVCASHSIKIVCSEDLTRFTSFFKHHKTGTLFKAVQNCHQNRNTPQCHAFNLGAIGLAKTKSLSMEILGKSLMNSHF